MISRWVIFRRRVSAVSILGVLGIFVLPGADAAFNGFMPLQHSGQVSYIYGYTENAGTQSESTRLLFGWNAAGYLWRPWFATTSMALNVGLSRAETALSSTEGTVGTGNFSIGVFPRSRFPFSVNISRTDSRAQQFQEVSQVSGETSFRVSRLTMRQSFRPRAYNQLYNGWYNSTVFDGGSFGSNNESYGLDYQLRIPRQTFSINTTHSGSSVRGGQGKSSIDVLSMSHFYSPSVELGVNSFASYVEVDPGGSNFGSADSQASSSFFWRPEHRAVSISGGVRLTESKSGSAGSSASRSLNTSLGLGYRLTRSLNMNASASVGASAGGLTQTLSTTQTVNISYAGGHMKWEGFSYSWQWGANASNSSTKVDSASSSNSASRQSIGTGMGHNLGKTWTVGRNSSLAATFSQSGSGSKRSGADVIGANLNHGASLSWSARGGRGSSYLSARLSDSRGFGEKDTVFDSFNLNYNADMTFDRLSNMTGTATYQSSRNESQGDDGNTEISTSKTMSGGMAYRHSRPFGVYNLQFTSNFLGSKQLDSPIPSATLRWESTFRYSLGLLSTSLSLRFSESGGGNSSKSMNFQATRSF